MLHRNLRTSVCSDPSALFWSGAVASEAAAGAGSGAGADGARAPAAVKKLRGVLCRFGIIALGTSTDHLCKILRILHDGR